ncbi:hypothetical protein [Microbacterium sp. 77mftsu3.1]|uniref:hypothetical protein n=1 Tax=Microbacterium sp. 77mftsu3.1 TaxID=1761802 RepID=UPI000380DB4A|nr:hypothetical protein [Microbacterium sp. 77mftsu3.1]SDH39629.1 hypothetical protein SAMN04488590_3230 [Microbacterium sp. 77mftsu3.1]
MSTPHENVVWQSADGTWSRGFYRADRWYDGDDDEGRVEFDMSEFEWVSTGHATYDEAHDAWDGANPAGYSVVSQPVAGEASPFESENPEHLDDLAAKLWVQHEKSPRFARERYSWERSDYCNGAPKRRVPRYLAEDIRRGLVSNARNKLAGYANVPTDVTSEVAELRGRIGELTAAERTHISRELESGAEQILGLITEHRHHWGKAAVAADEYAHAQAETLTNLVSEVAGTEPGVLYKPAAMRRKTSAKSTAGSFAPRSHSRPEIGF